MTGYRTPGRSFTRPPRISTMECSCRLWPTPGMYVVTSIPLVSRTRATFRSAEFGFLGVEVYTRVHTPRFCGQLFSAGLEVFQRGGFRPLRTSWLNVGTISSREQPKKLNVARPGPSKRGPKETSDRKKRGLL